MAKKKIIQEIDRSLIGLTSSELLKKFHNARSTKNTTEAEAIEKEFKRRDIKVVNKSLHE